MKRIRLIMAGLIVLHTLLLLAESGSEATANVELNPVVVPDYTLLNEPEKAQLAEMLAAVQLDSESMKFERDWDLSTWGKSNWHLNALQNPYAFMDQAARLRELCAEAEGLGLPALLTHLATVAWDTPGAIELYYSAYQQYQQQFKAEVRKPAHLFKFYGSMVQQLTPGIANAFSDHNKNHLDSLSAYFFTLSIESEDKDKYDKFFARNGLPDIQDAETEQIKELLKGLFEPALLASSLQYLAGCQVIADGAATLKYRNCEPLIKDSEYGVMIIGTTKDDRYHPAVHKALKERPVCLLIDPAGNDHYEMRLNTGWDNYTYLLIDYAGNDIYRSGEPAEMFFSLAGHGVSLDTAGDDIYQTDDFAFASFLGTNIHIDSAGNDSYNSGMFSQGAAMEGLSLLIDKEGRDSYRATTLAQGLGSIRSVGALLDYSGADLYHLGGKYLHAPLMPNDFRSMGQGMGFGARPDFAGGLGLLYDKGGNDQYLGGVYAQGVGYWYATGMLLDEAGNDVYNAIYYPQGSGIHLACGMLYDGGGDDAYYSRNGPGQGAGHDWACGILIDESGNDAYSLPGGNGLGLTNSVGLFIDKQGKDRYERKEAQNYGSANFSRSSGGIGLFLDAGGEDSYPDTLMANDKTWQKGSYGIGRDINLYLETEQAAAENITDDPLVAEDAVIDSVFAAASEWEVGSAIARVRHARNVLKTRTDEALTYIVANKLNSRSGLEYRALEEFLKDNEVFHQKLFDFVDDADSLKAKTAMSLIAGLSDSTLIVPVRRHLARGRYITACISLLGSIKTGESVELLAGYAFHASERYRYLVARSLRQIDNPAARAVLNAMKDDKSFLVQALLRNLPKETP